MKLNGKLRLDEDVVGEDMSVVEEGVSDDGTVVEQLLPPHHSIF